MGNAARKIEPPQDLSKFKVSKASEDYRGYAPAPVNRRIVAFLIDGLASKALASIIIGLFNALTHAKATIFTGLIGFVIQVLYWTFMEYNSGQTLGKMAMKIRVIDFSTGGLPSFGQTLMRESVGRIASAMPLMWGYLGASRRPDRRTWHDRMSKTAVIDLKAR